MPRQFKGVWIPAKIWTDRRLKATDKVLYAEIDSFTARDQGYFKANETIAEELGCSVSTVKRAVAKLIELNLIEVTNFDGRRRTLRATEPSAGPDRDDSRLKWTDQPAQNEPADSSERAKSKTEKKPKEKPNKLKMPIEGIEEAWEDWKRYKKEEHRFRFKSASTEAAQLTHLANIANNDPEKARQIIAASIANGWKGLFPLRRDTAPAGPTATDRDQFARYLNTGNL